jgi:HAE1 family hydrophobic/amphiphilic exporter-1
VLDGVENDKRPRGSTAGQRAIILAIQRQPGTNTIAGRRRRQGAAAAFREQLPPAIT